MNKEILKKWWFWVLVVVIGIPVCVGMVEGLYEGITGNITEVAEEKKPEKKETAKNPTPTPEITEEPTPKPTEKATEKPKGTKKPKKKSLKAQMKEAVQGYIDDNYILTNIDYISVNEDLGTEKKGDYIALIYLIWGGVANKTAKKNITTFSNDIAARIYDNFLQMHEVSVFWDVEISGDKAKMAFVRKKNGMYLDNEYWDLAFNE